MSSRVLCIDNRECKRNTLSHSQKNVQITIKDNNEKHLFAGEGEIALICHPPHEILSLMIKSYFGENIFMLKLETILIRVLLYVGGSWRFAVFENLQPNEEIHLLADVVVELASFWTVKFSKSKIKLLLTPSVVGKFWQFKFVFKILLKSLLFSNNRMKIIHYCHLEKKNDFNIKQINGNLKFQRHNYPIPLDIETFSRKSKSSDHDTIAWNIFLFFLVT